MTQADGELYHVLGLEELGCETGCPIPRAVYSVSVTPVRSSRTFSTESGQEFYSLCRNTKDLRQPKQAFFFLRFILYFGCGGSLLLHSHFIQLLQAGIICGSAWASRCGGFACCGAQALGTQASVAGVHRLSSCGRWAQLHSNMWDLPVSGTKMVVFLSLQGGFLTTGPSGKLGRSSLKKVKQLEQSGSLTLYYATKLQESGQHGTSTKRGIQISEARQKAQK